MISANRLKDIFDRIQNEDKKHVCIGFDGYIDTLYRVIRSRQSMQEFETYTTIGEFAHRLEKAAGRSADMELQIVSRRMGGNAPLMAEAMACLDISTRCIGAMGFPEPEDVFRTDFVHFFAHSVAPSADSMAFEFSDGKLMFGSTASLQSLNWEKIVGVIGIEKLRQWYDACDLLAVVNWSFLLNCNSILEGLLEDVIEKTTVSERKILFFDLADPSGRSKEDLQRLFYLMKKLSAKTRVVLSMNENESIQVANALELVDGAMTAVDRLSVIREKLGIYMTSVHGLDYAVAATKMEIVQEESIFVSFPAISTGGGDHFNGGFAAALTYGLPLADALALGNLVSSCYVSSGRSPTWENLAAYII